MIQFNALFSKEIKEAIRDKRALMAAFTMAFLAPVMIFVMSKMAIKEAVETPPAYVNISGGEYAPALMKHLADDNVFPMSEVGEADKVMWEKRNIEVIIPADFEESLLAGTSIKVVLRADYGEKAHQSIIRRVRDSVYNYSRQIGYQRIMMRGIDVNLLRPINLAEQDTQKPSSNATFISLMLSIYLLFGAFFSGLSVAIDTSAGERERNVLEILLCQPVSTMKVVLAKLFAATTIALIGVVLTLVLSTIAVGFVDLSQLGLTFNLDMKTAISLLILLIPICFFASALQLFFAFNAKTFKEAQSLVSIIIMLPGMIPFALSMMNDRPQWLDWAPISGQYLIMEDLFKGDPVGFGVLLVTGAFTVLMTVILVKVMAERLKSEKVVLALS